MDRAEQDKLRAECIQNALVRVRPVYGPEVNTKEEQPRIEVNGTRRRCPECGEYLVHGSDFGFDIKPWSCGDEGGWKHFIESGEQDE